MYFASQSVIDDFNKTLGILELVQHTLESIFITNQDVWERSGSVVECLTGDWRAAGSSLTGITALKSLSKTHLS